MTAPAPDATSPLDERLLEATTGTLELFGIYLGDRLGLYRALGSAGALTPDELAASAGIAPRYAREWLEQQAGARIPGFEGCRYRPALPGPPAPPRRPAGGGPPPALPAGWRGGHPGAVRPGDDPRYAARHRPPGGG